MNKYTPIIILIFIAGVAFVATTLMKTQADNYNVYDYIKQEKKGLDGYYVKKKFDKIVKDAGSYDPKYDPNLDMENGYTLLTFAFSREDLEFVFKLLKYKKADPHKRDKHGNSILTLALEKKQYDAASAFVQKYKASLNKKETKEFLKTIKKDDTQAIKWCIDNNIIIEDPKLINKNFAKFKTTKQIKAIVNGAKISEKNIKLFKKNYLRQNLEKISKTYKELSPANIFNANDRLKLFNRILKDIYNYKDYYELLDYVMADGVNISNKRAKQLIKDFLYRDWNNRSPRIVLFTHLYKTNKSAFDLDDELYKAVSYHWTKITQMLINDGAKYKEFKKLKPYSFRDIALFKLLHDNGYKFSKEQYKIYNNNLQKQKAKYFVNILQDSLHVAISSDTTHVYVATLNNITHKLSINKLNDKQKIQWTYKLEGKSYHNEVNNVAGLYYFLDKLILIQNKIKSSQIQTFLTILNKDGKKIKSIAIDGDYQQIVFAKNKFFIKTNKKVKYFDKNINELGKYIKHERYSGKSKASQYNSEEIRTKYLYDKTVNLTFDEIGDISKLQIDYNDSNTTKYLDIVKGDTIALDITQTKKAVYVITQTLKESKILKLTLDYGVYGYHYIKEDKDTKSLSSMKHIMKSIKLQNKSTLIAGQNNDLPTLEIYDTNNKKIVDKSYKFSFMRGHITSVKELGNGDILIIGRLYENYNFRKVFASLLSADGLPKWSRIYDDYQYIDNIVLDGDDSFMSLVGYEPIKLSLIDGKIIKKYKKIDDSYSIATTTSGYLYAIGNKQTNKSSSNKIYQPLLYCFAKDRKSFKKSKIGENGAYISNIYNKGEDIYATYEFVKGEGSMSSNKIIVKITKQCQVNFKWEK